MANTSIVVSGYTFVFQTGDIDTIEEQIMSKAEQQSIAATSPAGSRLYDYDGTIKVITIRGALTDASSTRVVGYTITTMLAQKQWLESIINGSQTDIELNDDYAGQTVLTTAGATPPYLGAFTSTIAFQSEIKFTRRRGQPNKIEFSLTLFVGTTT